MIRAVGPFSKVTLEELIEWIDGRSKRFRARKGGLVTKYEKRAYEICAADGIRWDQLTSKSRQPHVLSVRRKIAKELRGMGCSLRYIASILKRHHSAVMNLIDRKACRRKSEAEKAKGFDPIHLGC